MKIPLSNGGEAEVDEVDHLPALLFGSWNVVNGYVSTGRGKTHVRLHEFIGKRMGLLVTETIDHKNRDKLDCRRENLQAATYTEQNLNRAITVGLLGLKYISYDRGKYKVQVRSKGKRKHVGVFDTEEEAVKARDKFLRENP